MARKKRSARLGELGRTPLGLMLGLGLVIAVATAVAVPVLSGGGGRGSGPDVAEAHINPVGCNTGSGGSAGLIDAPGTVPPGPATRFCGPTFE